MKAHTSEFKEKIKEFGRELDSKITYGTTELGKEELNSVTPHYESAILKSVMKQLDVDSNVEIPLETVINYQFGVKVGNGYEYLDYGNYVVYNVEKQEDTRSWKITCYDKMLYAMIPYESLGVSYPISIRDYLQAICTKLGLTLASGDFANEDKQIMSELYLDANGNGLDYTFRDVLDEIAQATGSTICINENDELEVRYPQNVGEYETVEGTDLLLENVDDVKDINYELNGDTTQDGTPTPTTPIEVETVTGRQEIDVYGKNLLGVKDGSYSANGITATVSNGEITLNGTASANAFVSITTNSTISWEANTSYTISTFNSVANSNLKLRVNSGGQLDTTLNNTNKTQTINVGSYADMLSTSITIRVQSGTALSNFKLKPMIEKGSTATEYEDFKGQSYEINLGKNLFDGNYENAFIGGTSGNTFTYASNTRTAIVKVKPNTTYTITKYDNNGRGNRFSIFEYPTILTTTTDMGASSKLFSNSNVFTATVTTSSTGNYLYVYVTNDTSNIPNLQIEKGSKATSYVPYKTPIELCKIGNYKDFIKKGIGKNLFGFNISAIDKTETYRVNVNQRLAIEGTNNPNECKFTFGSGSYCRGYFEIDGIDGTLPYTLSFNIKENTSSYTPFYTIDTTNSTNNKLVFYINGNNGSTSGNTGQYFILTNIQLELGSQSTFFEPYGTNDKWLLHKEIGKIVLNGSENWTKSSATTFDQYWYGFGSIVSTVRDGVCNRLVYSTTPQNNTFDIKNNNANTQSVLWTTFELNSIGTLANFKTWLSTHPISVYYILSTPTTTEITDTELINQLNSVELLEGMNNISILSGDLSTPLKLTYLSEMDTIDEEYLKDVNVNFGEKFGPVNSVVLSRAAESDSIYQMDEESVEQNGLTEVKIKDNQILNGNNRDEFLSSIFNKLNGLEYYLTDFSSTGVAYYDLLDKYKINVFDNSYKTIMFNNEVDITQGLEEQIYANKLEESETDYTKSDKTDRKINQAYIIVDKQNQQINSVVQSINTLQSVVNSQGEQVDALGTRITQTIDNITASVTSIEGQLENGVNLVKTTSVTIDDNGLNVSTDSSRISTTMTNNSFQIKDSGDNVLAFFGYDETENASKSQMDNLTVTNYFVAGNHRIEKFERNSEKRTGYFYIG